MPKPVIATQTPLDSPFNRQRAKGHALRKGHELNAVQVSADNLLFFDVDLCCGEVVPAEVKTWAEATGP